MNVRLAVYALVLLTARPGSAAQDKPAENAQMLAALAQYARADFEPATAYLQSISSLKQLQFDLDRSSNGWLKGTAVSATMARKSLAGFALEASVRHLSDPNAGKLIEWACKFIRDDTGADEFDRRWMRASLAALEGAMQPKLLAAHLEHVKARLPDEPHLVLARAVADEQRTAPWFAKSGVTASDILPFAESAIRKFQDAAQIESVHAEAMLHIGVLDGRLRRDDAAIVAFRDVESHTTDPSLIYLARVFRGQALERQSKNADAQAAYRAALEIVPGGSSATLSLAALLTTMDQRTDASALIDGLLTATERVNDPWWSYWPADFRYIDNLLLQMREALR